MIDIGKILDAARSAKIMVLGDVMLDAYDFCYTANSRPSPERQGALVYTAHRAERMLGGAGNVAANLAALGVDTALIGLCGTDGNGVDVQQLCDKAGIRHRLVPDTTRLTTVKTRLYIDDQYHLRRDDEDTHEINAAVADAVRASFLERMDGVDAVILSDYDKGFFTADLGRFLVRHCRESGVPVIVDFKPVNHAYFHQADVVAPNLSEARMLVPHFAPADPSAGLVSLRKLLQAKSVMVTLGAEGLVVYDGVKVMRIPGRTVPAVDPCGCGDTVRACLTLGLVSGLSLAAAADFANYAASLVVQKLGTAALEAKELMIGAERYE